MNAEELRAIQAPLKQGYRDHPETARNIARAEAIVEPYDIACTIRAWHGEVTAGLHQSAGGSGELACSADTLRAVATAMGITVNGGRIVAEGIWDVRGTLGVDRTAPVGLSEITLRFDIDCDADAARMARLIQTTERYCVILQTLRNPPVVSLATAAAA